MKYYVLVLTVFIASQMYSQEKKPEDFVKFRQKNQDFGKIKQGKPVSFEFVFDNISNGDVVLEEVLPPCSCNIVSKPDGKILKGKSDKIKVEYNAISPGPFDREISVKLAGINNPLTLKIRGEVLNENAYDEYVKTQN